MANPSVTYTWSDGTNMDATMANQNFTDVINGFSDGSSDINMATGFPQGDVVCSGDATVSGDIYTRSNMLVRTTTALGELSVDGTALITGDIRSSDGWVDIADIVRISGWSSFDTKVIKYKRMGLEYVFAWDIDGTSDSGGAFFNLPALPQESMSNSLPSNTMYAVDDNTAITAGGRSSIYGSPQGKYIALDQNWSGASWTSSQPTPSLTRYLNDAASSDVAGYDTLTAAAGSDATNTIVLIDSSGKTLIEEYIMDGANGFGQVDSAAAQLTAGLVGRTDNAAGTTKFILDLYYRRSGTEYHIGDATQGYPWMDTTAKSKGLLGSMFADYTLLSTDQIVAKVSALTDHTVAMNVSLYPKTVSLSSSFTAPIGPTFYGPRKHCSGQLTVWLRE